MSEHTIQLNDGRNLGYGTYGDTSGKPVLYFHGTPGCRFDAELFHTLAMNNHIHLISVERPGYGLSDEKCSYTYMDWVKDVRELMKELKMEKVDIIGVSGGAPYALSCAEQLCSKIGRVAIVCGLVPFDSEEARKSIAKEDQMLMDAAQNTPEQVAPVIENIHNNPHRMVEESTSSFTDFDKKIITNEVLEKFPRIIKEATRSSEGMIRDYKLFGQPWNINFKDINVPVYFWNGDLDQSISVKVASSFADRFRKVKFNLIEGAGHFGTAVVGPERAILLLANEK